MKLFEEYKKVEEIDKLLYKPAPDFSCLNPTEDELKQQLETYLKKLESFTFDFDIDVSLESLMFESPSEIVEAYGDALKQDDFVESLKKKYGFFDSQIKKVEYNNGVGIYMMYIRNKSLEKMIDIEMRKHDWFLSFSSSNGDIVSLFFEPSSQANISDVVFKQRYIYHYTQSNRVKNIMKQGLEPRHERVEYVYPERIYFSLYENDKIAITLRNSLIKHNLSPDWEYTLLRIDLSKVDKETKFYYDVFAEKCVFTVDSIRSECIEKVREIAVTAHHTSVLQNFSK